MTLRIDRSEDRRHPASRHLRRRSTTSPGTQVAATAEQGRFLSTDDPDTILFRLQKGRLIQDSPKFADAAHPVVRQLRSADQPARASISFRSRGHEELRN